MDPILNAAHFNLWKRRDSNPCLKSFVGNASTTQPFFAAPIALVSTSVCAVENRPELTRGLVLSDGQQAACFAKGETHYSREILCHVMAVSPSGFVS